MLDSWQGILRIVLAVFVDYRLSELISLDYGPDHIFERFKLWTGRQAASHGNEGIWSSIAELVACPFCLGVWFAIPLMFLIVFPSVPGDIFLVFLAITGGQTYLESTSNGRKDI